MRRTLFVVPSGDSRRTNGVGVNEPQREFAGALSFENSPRSVDQPYLQKFPTNFARVIPLREASDAKNSAAALTDMTSIATLVSYRPC